MDKTTQELLQQLRAQYGDAEALRLDPDNASSPIVALRKPTLAEYLECAEVFARIESGDELKDPGLVTRPLLALVVHGDADARAELDRCFGFTFDMFGLVKLLAGQDNKDVELKEAPDAVTNDAKAASSRAMAFRCDGFVVCARPLDGFDFLRFQARNATARAIISRKALAEMAEQQVIEAKDENGKKPNYQALLARWPAAAVALGLELMNRASSKAKRIEGK